MGPILKYNEPVYGRIPVSHCSTPVSLIVMKYNFFNKFEIYILVTFYIIGFVYIEQLDSLEVSALSVRSQKFSNVRNGR
jgi:hypothetical protein